MVQGPTRTPVSCTMYTAPQVLRNRGKTYEQMAPYAPVCDVWSAAVTLHYLVYAKWPFSKNQILSWASPGSTVEWEKVKFSKSALPYPPPPRVCFFILKKYCPRQPHCCAPFCHTMAMHCAVPADASARMRS